MVITSWGLDNNYNRVWYPQLYDADSCLGLTNDGELKYGSGIDPDTGDFNTSNSQLWVKLNRNFKSEIIARYKQLRRDGWFTVEKLMQYYNDDLIGKVGQRFYNEDARQKYMGGEGEPTRAYAYLANGTRLEYTKRWLEERINYLDSIYEHGDYATHQATIRTNVKDVLKLRIKTYSPQMVMVKFSDATGSEVKKYVSNDKWYEFSSAEAEAFKSTGGVVENDKDNNLGIYGTHNIMAVDGFEDLNVSHMLLGAMPKITTLELPRSKYITELNLDNNRMLQTLNLKGCVNLGAGSSISGNNVGAIDLSNCINLKYVDISGTKLTAITFNDNGGALEYFDASETSITDITLQHQPYLPSIKMGNCRDLTSIRLQNCERLETLSVPNAKISSFNVVDCNALTAIDLSNNGQLRSLSLDGCPNLESLNLSGFSSENCTELMLDTCEKLKTLDISGSSFLTYVTFAQDYTALKTLNARSSVLQSFRFGRRVDYPTYLDLTPFNLTSINFYNCPELREIRGLNYNGSGSGVFYNCSNLETIEGTLTLTGNMNQAFYNCVKLTNLPTMNLSAVTSGSESFSGCKELTLAQAKSILSTCSNLGSTYRFFSGCTNISGTLTEDMFVNTPKISSMSDFFSGCTGITGQLPEELLKPMGENLTSVRSAFSGTKITGGVPANFFKYNTNLENTIYAFSSCTGLTDPIPESLFANNVKLKYTYGMFNGCSNIVSTIPERLFANNTKLVEIDTMFNGCSKLYGKIPNTLFRSDSGDKYAITNMTGLFQGCGGLYGDVPTNFLRDCPSLTNVDNLFYGCDLSGSIPSNFFANNPMLTTASGVFRNNSSITGAIPSAIFKGLTNLSDISYFFGGCSGIQSSIPEGLLNDNVALTKLQGLFYGCTKLVGEIPENLFDNTGSIQTISGVFQGCENLTSEIPEGLFKNCRKVVDMSNIFNGSYRLYGAIPKDLFRNCSSVQSLAGAFANCNQLGDRTVNSDNPYGVPETLLSDCPQLRDVNHMFQGGSSLTGELPTSFFEANANLVDTHNMFTGCPLKVKVTTEMFQRNRNLTNTSGMFWGSNVTLLEDGAFNNCSKLENVSEMFKGNSGMQGTAHPFWNKTLHPLITESGQAECYRNCTGLSNYDDIPVTWK